MFLLQCHLKFLSLLLLIPASKSFFPGLPVTVLVLSGTCFTSSNGDDDSSYQEQTDLPNGEKIVTKEIEGQFQHVQIAKATQNLFEGNKFVFTGCDGSFKFHPSVITRKQSKTTLFEAILLIKSLV